jgi:RNA polymerase sigma factor (TIGR02999 family)
MTHLSQVLAQIELEGITATDEMLPLVYDDLRRLAAEHLAHEKPGMSLQATALVHEAYLRLVGSNPTERERESRWDGQRHFFAAASEAMRRILVEHARRKQRLKRGGTYQQRDLAHVEILAPIPSDDVIAVHETLERLEAVDAQAARLVKLRYFLGFTIPEAAQQLDVSPRKANQLWAYARAWMLAEMANFMDHRIPALPR